MPDVVIVRNYDNVQQSLAA